MKLLYFAWVKQKAGIAEEDVTLPGEVYELAFADLSVIRCAVDQEHGDFSTPITGASEIAFFPPVTGG